MTDLSKLVESLSEAIRAKNWKLVGQIQQQIDAIEKSQADNENKTKKYFATFQPTPRRPPLKKFPYTCKLCQQSREEYPTHVPSAEFYVCSECVAKR